MLLHAPVDSGLSSMDGRVEGNRRVEDACTLIQTVCSHSSKIRQENQKEVAATDSSAEKEDAVLAAWHDAMFQLVTKKAKARETTEVI